MTRRSEMIATAAVVLLAVLGVVLLWPGDEPARSPGPGAPEASATTGVTDSELARLRAAAGQIPCPAPGEDAPAAKGPLAGITVPCLGAPGEVDLGRALAGRTVLLNAWASWCVPCRAELPALAQYAARPGAVPVLGVAVRDDPRAALGLLAETGVALPAVTDPQDRLRAALNMPPGLPLSYLVRPDGSVTLVSPPIPFRNADEVAAAVERLS